MQNTIKNQIIKNLTTNTKKQKSLKELLEANQGNQITKVSFVDYEASTYKVNGITQHKPPFGSFPAKANPNKTAVVYSATTGEITDEFYGVWNDFGNTILGKAVRKERFCVFVIHDGKEILVNQVKTQLGYVELQNDFTWNLLEKEDRRIGEYKLAAKNCSFEKGREINIMDVPLFYPLPYTNAEYIDTLARKTLKTITKPERIFEDDPVNTMYEEIHEVYNKADSKWYYEIYPNKTNLHDIGTAAIIDKETLRIVGWYNIAPNYYLFKKKDAVIDYCYPNGFEGSGDFHKRRRAKREAA